MNLTIVKEDALVIIDNQPQQLDFTVFSFPETFCALQWKGSKGEIEFQTRNESIDKLPEWIDPIISEYNRVTEKTKKQLEQEEKQVIAIQNGAARKLRIQKANQQDQQKINDYIRSIM